MVGRKNGGMAAFGSGGIHIYSALRFGGIYTRLLWEIYTMRPSLYYKQHIMIIII